MLDKLVHIFIVDCVKNVPEVSSVGQATVRSRIWHVDHEVCDFPQKRPKLLHREFIVLGDVDLLQFTQREELLLFNEYLFDEVLIQHLCWRNVKLQLVLEILDEVILGTEARKHLLWQAIALLRFRLCLVWRLLVFHSFKIIKVTI